MRRRRSSSSPGADTSRGRAGGKRSPLPCGQPTLRSTISESIWKPPPPASCTSGGCSIGWFVSSTRSRAAGEPCCGTSGILLRRSRAPRAISAREHRPLRRKRSPYRRQKASSPRRRALGGRVRSRGVRGIAIAPHPDRARGSGPALRRLPRRDLARARAGAADRRVDLPGRQGRGTRPMAEVRREGHFRPRFVRGAEGSGRTGFGVKPSRRMGKRRTHVLKRNQINPGERAPSWLEAVSTR